jgi:hypothetical protein
MPPAFFTVFYLLGRRCLTPDLLQMLHAHASTLMPGCSRRCPWWRDVDVDGSG